MKKLVDPFILIRVGSEHQRVGAEEACWAHNPKVGGSKPPFAIFFLFRKIVHTFRLGIITVQSIDLTFFKFCIPSLTLLSRPSFRDIVHHILPELLVCSIRFLQQLCALRLYNKALSTINNIHDKVSTARTSCSSRIFPSSNAKSSALSIEHASCISCIFEKEFSTEV